MDWDKLRVFHAVAEAGSFTNAANKLNLSQSAISRQISGLEQDLGVSLFNRHARGLVLTEQGETLYHTAHDVLLKLDLVQTKLSDSKEKPEGKLRVTTTVALGTGWLANRISDFIDLYPDIQLQLLLENEELDLATREADCAIRLRQPTQPDLIQRRLFTVHFHIYASPKYVKAYGQPKTIEDLDNHRIAAFGEGAPAYLSEINLLTTVGMPAHKSRRPAFEVNSLIAIRKIVESGAAIALLPDYIVDDKHNLVQLMQSVHAPEFDTYFCYTEELRGSAKLKAFRDFLISKARLWKF